MKTKPHIIVLSAVLVLLGVIVSPACAVEYSAATFPSQNTTETLGESVNSFDFDASPFGHGISLIYIDVNHGSRVDFTLYYGNQSTVSGYTESALLNGSWNPFDPNSLFRATTVVSLNGVTDSYTYLAANRFYDVEVAGYGYDSNSTPNSGFLFSSDKYGVGDNDLGVFFVVPQIQRNLIYRVTATGTGDPFTIKVVHAPVSDVAAFASRSTWQTAQDWINFAFSIGGLLFGYIMMVWGLLTFITNNWLLILALYISVSMAYSALSSKNIFMFYKRFFGFQRSMFNFVVELWNYLIQIVASFRGIFRI